MQEGESALKLFYCINCADVMRIIVSQKRVCSCGKSTAKFDSETDYTIGGECVSLDMDISLLRQAFQREGNLIKNSFEFIKAAKEALVDREKFARSVKTVNFDITIEGGAPE
jgi:hypothetical protein